MKFEEVKADYEKLTGKYGQPYDMTGGFEAEDRMEEVILSPTKSNAKRYLISVIRYGFEHDEYWRSENGSDGGENLSIHEDEFLKKMYNKYILGI